jgi:NADH-quinone oxidoreductase subunit E
MLTDDDKQAIRADLAHFEVLNSSASVDALLAVQKRRGWVSDESLNDVAALLGMTAAELDAVATFYCFIFRKPVGRHVITLCDSMVCWAMGLNPLYEHLSNRLGIVYGGTTEDNRFTLLPAACLGVCDRAPAIMVDDDLHGPVEPAMLEEILKNYV